VREAGEEETRERERGKRWRDEIKGERQESGAHRKEKEIGMRREIR
jgi:hypothetical protein